MLPWFLTQLFFVCARLLSLNALGYRFARYGEGNLTEGVKHCLSSSVLLSASTTIARRNGAPAVCTVSINGTTETDLSDHLLLHLRLLLHLHLLLHRLLLHARLARKLLCLRLHVVAHSQVHLALEDGLLHPGRVFREFVHHSGGERESREQRADGRKRKTNDQIEARWCRSLQVHF